LHLCLHRASCGPHLLCRRPPSAAHWRPASQHLQLQLLLGLAADVPWWQLVLCSSSSVGVGRRLRCSCFWDVLPAWLTTILSRVATSLSIQGIRSSRLDPLATIDGEDGGSYMVAALAPHRRCLGVVGLQAHGALLHPRLYLAA
jgi:hypothetical protein